MIFLSIICHFEMPIGLNTFSQIPQGFCTLFPKKCSASKASLKKEARNGEA
jgi:hypothetical protein